MLEFIGTGFRIKIFSVAYSYKQQIIRITLSEVHSHCIHSMMLLTWIKHRFERNELLTFYQPNNLVIFPMTQVLWPLSQHRSLIHVLKAIKSVSSVFCHSPSTSTCYPFMDIFQNLLTSTFHFLAKHFTFNGIGYGWRVHRI